MNPIIRKQRKSTLNIVKNDAARHLTINFRNTLK